MAKLWPEQFQHFVNLLCAEFNKHNNVAAENREAAYLLLGHMKSTVSGTYTYEVFKSRMMNCLSILRKNHHKAKLYAVWYRRFSSSSYLDWLLNHRAKTELPMAKLSSGPADPSSSSKLARHRCPMCHSTRYTWTACTSMCQVQMWVRCSNPLYGGQCPVFRVTPATHPTQHTAQCDYV